MAREPWTAAVNGVVVDVRLTPRCGRDAIDGIELLADGRSVVRARVRAAPEAGEANAALCRLVAEAAGVAPRQVVVAKGATARLKRLSVAGDAGAIVAALRRRLAEQK